MSAEFYLTDKDTAKDLKGSNRTSFTPAQSNFCNSTSKSSIFLASKVHLSPDSPAVDSPNNQSNIASDRSNQKVETLSAGETVVKILEERGVKYASGVSVGAIASLRQTLEHSSIIEWARIASDKVIVASADRAWLCRLSSARREDRFIKPMKCAGSIATTQKLLDGAIAAAKCAVKSNVRPSALTPIRQVWRLAGAYHLYNSTPVLMEEACVGFSLLGRWNLAEWAAEKANQEEGHNRLALRDIQSMGYDAEAVVKALVPPAAVALIDYFTRSVRDWNPIDCVGYSYTMESLARGVGEEYIQKAEVILPLGIDANRNLGVHSSVGDDAEHLEETVKMLAGLPAKERTRVAKACYETALMCFNPPQESYISDLELQQILKPLKLSKKS